MCALVPLFPSDLPRKGGLQLGGLESPWEGSCCSLEGEEGLLPCHGWALGLSSPPGLGRRWFWAAGWTPRGHIGVEAGAGGGPACHQETHTHGQYLPLETELPWSV